jgi:hypothetical protein
VLQHCFAGTSLALLGGGVFITSILLGGMSLFGTFGMVTVSWHLAGCTRVCPFQLPIPGRTNNPEMLDVTRPRSRFCGGETAELMLKGILYRMMGRYPGFFRGRLRQRRW